MRAATNSLMAVLGKPYFDPTPFWLPWPYATIQLRVLANVAGLYLSLRKMPDGPGTSVELAPPRSNSKAAGNLGERIVLFGQDVEHDHLLRLPLLRSGEDRNGLLLRGEPYPETTTGIERLGRSVFERDLQHVVDLAGHRLRRLDQDLLEGRNQWIGGLVGRVGDAEREKMGRQRSLLLVRRGGQ